MSVVAVRKTEEYIEIASDSIRVHGYHVQEKCKDAKLFKIDDKLTLGAVGDARDGEMFRIFLRSHSPAENTKVAVVDLMVEFMEWIKSKDSNIAQIESEFLLVYEGSIYRATGQLFVCEIEDYCAIGAGEEFALAALYLGKDVKEAVRCACHFSIYCEEPINYFKIPLSI